MASITSNSLNDRYLRLYGIPISVFVLLLSQMPVFFPGRWDLFWKYVLISVLYTSLLWEISRWILLRIRRRYPTVAETRRRVLLNFFTFSVLVAVGQLLVTLLIMVLHLQSPQWISLGHTWGTNFFTSLFFVVLIGGVYETIYFFQQYKTALQKAEQLKKQQVRQRLDALKNQVNPHFLFNALTTLSALIGEDGPRAERFVDELSKVYRYLLRASRQPVMSLEEEMQFARSYVFLLKNRFEEGAFILDMGSAVKNEITAHYSLPALSMQNALDYLIRTQHLPLRIEMEAGEGKLEFSCNDRPKQLTFENDAADRSQMEEQGAHIASQGGRLRILIPLQQSRTAP
jgi:hypothetical protein